MATQLHVIYPAEEYIPGGTQQLVDLTCIADDDGPVKRNKLLPVVLQITEEPFGVVEVQSGPWIAGYVPATKITDACTGDIIYVTEYITDVAAAAECCLPFPPGPPNPTVYYPYEWFWGAVDHSQDLEGGVDELTYQGNSTSAQNDSSLTADFRAAPADQFYVVRTRIQHPIFNHYDNSIGVNGPIPDPIWNAPFEYDIYRYYTTKVAGQFSNTALTTLEIQ